MTFSIEPDRDIVYGRYREHQVEARHIAGSRNLPYGRYKLC